MKLGIATRLAHLLNGDPVPNEDPETGIHFGVISSNDETLNGDAIEDIFRDGADVDVEERVSDAIEPVVKLLMFWAELGDHAFNAKGEIEEKCFHMGGESLMNAMAHVSPWTEAEVRKQAILNFDRDSFLGELTYEPTFDESRILYEKDGYKILKARDGDLFVEKSPYYALRGYCSPCAPNACHLKTAGDEQTYCLGPDWFEEGKMPYECRPVGDHKKETP